MSLDYQGVFLSSNVMEGIVESTSHLVAISRIPFDLFFFCETQLRELRIEIQKYNWLLHTPINSGDLRWAIQILKDCDLWKRSAQLRVRHLLPLLSLLPKAHGWFHVPIQPSNQEEKAIRLCVPL